MNRGTATLVVVIAGSRWENTRGTDHRLAESLAKKTHVLWVDPPVPFSGPASKGKPPLIPGFEIDGLRPGLMRLRVVVPPGFTRAVVRTIASSLQARAIRLALAELKLDSTAKILLSPREKFPRNVRGTNVLHITDDWEAGAELMGLSRDAVRKTLTANISDADLITAVSPYLAELIHEQSGKPVVVLPNGCASQTTHPNVDESKRRAVVGLVGQLNERLDMNYLEALAESGIPVEVIGPRRDKTPEISSKLDRFLGAKNIVWRGEMSELMLGKELEEFSVGITPYADNEFNRASFPIKTLDYLAAGLPVIATDLPAVQWLDSEWIKVVQSPEEFVNSLKDALAGERSSMDAQKRRDFAQQHTWDARARELLTLIAGSSQ